MKKVLLAIGNSEYSKIIQRHLLKNQENFLISEQEVMHHKYLEEIIELEKPDILIVHDYYLPTDTINKLERENEWLAFLKEIRENYDDSIRVVFLCERTKGDPFLHGLVNSNVLDIFNNQAIDMSEFVEQLKNRPRFSKVSKFIKIDSVSSKEENQLEQETIEENVEEEEKEQEEPKEKPKTTKTINNDIEHKLEKPIVQKVVKKNVINKQVVKRDYNIQVLNQVEKVVGVPIEKKLIMIGSPFSRSGSTFVSHILARELAKMNVSVSYIESPYSYAYSYDRFIGHELNPNYRSKFYQFTKEIDPKLPSVFDWRNKDINMIVKHPDNEPIYDQNEVPFDVFIKILLASPSTVTILDVGTDWGKSIYSDIFDIASNAYLVLEPDISNIQYLEEPDNLVTAVFRNILKDTKTRIIGNRFDKRILKNEIFQELYKDKIETVIPDIPSKEVFDCQYSGNFINDSSNYSGPVEKALLPLIQQILPTEYLKKYAKQNSLFKNLFNKKITVNKN